MRKTLILFILLVAVRWATAGGGKEGSEKPVTPARDTVQAVVLYGEELLFDAVDGLEDIQIEALRDSIMRNHGANELCNYLNLYLSIKSKTDEELTAYVDSLFDEDEVPFALINQINIYIMNRPDEIPVVIPKDLYVADSALKIPCQHFYPKWVNTNPNPYSGSLGKEDTTLSLLLRGNELLGEFTLPIDNVITSKFGWRDGRNHNGIDVDLEVWDPVKTVFPGVVRVARTYGGYGRVVVVRHYNGLETTYAHLHRFKVKEGEVVTSGQVIGLGGSSGHSTGSHLHFEVRFKGRPINPLSFISFKEKDLVNDTLMLKRTPHGYLAYPKGIMIHTVKKGDTLYDIAKIYGTTTYKLAELNSIRRNGYLYIGQRIRVI
jgi:murein DD-endopeptidase MepM/ murein hydrolase activator NlpD